MVPLGVPPSEVGSSPPFTSPSEVGSLPPFMSHRERRCREPVNNEPTLQNQIHKNVTLSYCFCDCGFVAPGMSTPKDQMSKHFWKEKHKNVPRAATGFFRHMFLSSNKRSASGQRSCHPFQCSQVFSRSQKVIEFPLSKKSPSVPRQVISLTWGGQPVRTCSSAVAVAEREKTLCRAGALQSEGAKQRSS